MNSTPREVDNDLTGAEEGVGLRPRFRPSGALSFLKRLLSLASVRRREPRLRLREMVQLGEKRFVAVVQYGREKFLLAGTPQAICLLQRWEGEGPANEAAPAAATDVE